MAASVSAESKTAGTLLRWARQALREAAVDNAAQEATWLVEHALDLHGHRLVVGSGQALTAERWDRAEALIRRRAAREPLQYLLGAQEFCGLEFEVNPSVLIPRPETELLVQEVIRRGSLRQGAVLVDVGTGSGCLAVTLATIMQEARIVATDQSAEALQTAKRNAAKQGVEQRIEWLEGDLLAPLRDMNMAGAVEVMVSNPPYIAESDWAGLQPEVRLFEPRAALLAGARGTEFHERLLRDAHEFLVAGGVLLLEVGAGQAQAVREFAEGLGRYVGLQVLKDAGGIERVVIVERTR
jgi:release factor glutamine methyltransferase